MKLISIIFLLAANMSAFADLDFLKYETLDEKRSILVVSQDGLIYTVILNDGVKLSGFSPQKIEFKKPNLEPFSISLPRSSIVTFVSASIVSSLPKSKTEEVIPILEKHSTTRLEIIFQKLMRIHGNERAPLPE